MDKDKKERKIWEVLSIITPSDLNRLPDDYSYYGRTERLRDIFDKSDEKEDSKDKRQRPPNK